jgi:putative transcriptional regulator
MGKFGAELIESMQQAARHSARKKVRGLRVSRVELSKRLKVRLTPTKERTELLRRLRSSQ